MRHVQLLETATAGKFVMRVVGSTELERLLDSGKIDRDQFDTGVRLAELRHWSGADGVGVSWAATGCPGSWRGGRLEQMSEEQEHAWRRYSAAMRSLPPTCRQEVEAVCVLDRPVLRINALRDGLDLLAKAW
jgi:hypothetical protein